jgi:hypothetical protein
LQKLFRRKPVPEMSEDTGQSELELPGRVAQVLLGSWAPKILRHSAVPVPRGQANEIAKGMSSSA